MKNQIVCPVFPQGIEADGFIAALSSIVCNIRHYTDDTPYWCNPKNRYCTHCGDCTGQNISAHQQSIYHALLAASGLAFTFDYPEDDSVPNHTMPNAPTGWRWDEPFIKDIMDFAGLSYERAADMSIYEIRERMISLTDKGYPALAANNRVWKNEMEWVSAWRIICGYTENGVLVMRHGGEITEETDGAYEDIIFITGEAKTKQTYQDVLKRIYAVITDPSHDALEEEIMNDLSNVTPENAVGLSFKMMGINGVPAEARWHAAEAFISQDNLISALDEGKELHSTLSKFFFDWMIDNPTGEDTHAVCWKIWGCLNVGPGTGYMPTEESFSLIQKAEVQDELKRLYGIVFENDRLLAREIKKYI